jgi:hypothetical protein
MKVKHNREIRAERKEYKKAKRERLKLERQEDREEKWSARRRMQLEMK